MSSKLNVIEYVQGSLYGGGWVSLCGEVTNGMMGNGHMGTPTVDRQNDRQTDTTQHITFP